MASHLAKLGRPETDLLIQLLCSVVVADKTVSGREVRLVVDTLIRAGAPVTDVEAKEAVITYCKRIHAVGLEKYVGALLPQVSLHAGTPLADVFASVQKDLMNADGHASDAELRLSDRILAELGRKEESSAQNTLVIESSGDEESAAPSVFGIAAFGADLGKVRKDQTPVMTPVLQQVTEGHSDSKEPLGEPDGCGPCPECSKITNLIFSSPVCEHCGAEIDEIDAIRVCGAYAGDLSPADAEEDPQPPDDSAHDERIETAPQTSVAVPSAPVRQDTGHTFGKTAGAAATTASASISILAGKTEKTKLRTLTLPSAYAALGRHCYERRQNVDMCADLYAEMDALRSEIESADKTLKQASQGKTFFEKAKELANKGMVALKSQQLAAQERSVMGTVGERVYEKYGAKSGPVVLTQPIAVALARLIQLEATLEETGKRLSAASQTVTQGVAAGVKHVGSVLTEHQCPQCKQRGHVAMSKWQTVSTREEVRAAWRYPDGHLSESSPMYSTGQQAWQEQALYVIGVDVRTGQCAECGHEWKQANQWKYIK